MPMFYYFNHLKLFLSPSFSLMVQRWGRDRVSTLSCSSSSWTSSTYSAKMSKTLTSLHRVKQTKQRTQHFFLEAQTLPISPIALKNRKTTTPNTWVLPFDLFSFYCPDCQGDRPEGQMGTVMENMVLFTTMLLQKLYSGTFRGDNENLLNFLADQIGTVREATDRNLFLP